MDEQAWNQVDAYVTARLVGEDTALDGALRASDAAGLPPIQVSPPQGKFLHLLAASVGARRLLEIGTLAGYSTIWLARAAGPHGRVISLEVNQHHAEIARENLRRAGVDGTVEVRTGTALELLPQLQDEGVQPFDFVFIDADKPPTAEYFDWAVRLARPGAVIVVDNVVRNGALADANTADDNVKGMRRFLESVASDARVSATVVQTVGIKGYDGFLLARVSG